MEEKTCVKRLTCSVGSLSSGRFDFVWFGRHPFLRLAALPDPLGSQKFNAGIFCPHLQLSNAKLGCIIGPNKPSEPNGAYLGEGVIPFQVRDDVTGCGSNVTGDFPLFVAKQSVPFHSLETSKASTNETWTNPSKAVMNLTI